MYQHCNIILYLKDNVSVFQDSRFSCFSLFCKLLAAKSHFLL